jgi:capsular polysaccharide biosynthesis protein
MSEKFISDFENKKTVNFAELMLLAIKRWFIIVPIMVVCLVLSFIYSTLIATPMFDSTAKLYVVNKETQVVNSVDFSISTYLTNDFTEIIGDMVVLEEVANDLGNKYDIDTLKGFITVSQPENTRIIEITVRSPKAEDSKQIADSICRISQDKLVDVMGFDRINIIRNGSLEKFPSSPSTVLNLIYAFIFGAIVSAIIVLTIYLTDNKISTKQDVEKYLNLSVLASIPYNQSKQKPKY